MPHIETVSADKTQSIPFIQEAPVMIGILIVLYAVFIFILIFSSLNAQQALACICATFALMLGLTYWILGIIKHAKALLK